MDTAKLKAKIGALLEELKPLEKVKVKSISHATERDDSPQSRAYVVEFTNGKTIRVYIYGTDRCQKVSKNLAKATYLGIDKGWLTGTGYPTTMAKVGVRIRVPRADGKGDAMLGFVNFTEGKGRQTNDYVVD